MCGTIENTHGKICDKIGLVGQAIDLLSPFATSACRGDLDKIEENYNLSIVTVFSDYYSDAKKEEAATREYYKIISRENVVIAINNIINKLQRITSAAHHANQEDVSKLLYIAKKMHIESSLEVNDYEVCKKCGSRMIVMPELSELHCENAYCGKIKVMFGVVFRDDQFYPQEGQKTKHGRYDTSRHYKFWIERLQALEAKTFEPEDLAKIEYVINRDGYKKYELNCKLIRRILKDPCVNKTDLNDHTPLLVKTLGGRAPPVLDFHENRIISIRFNKVMVLYDVVNPDGGNKPYYPYFLYKLIEDYFRNDAEKLRFLDYIHLQSRETVIKNDKYYEKIAKLATKEDGIVYTPTDPAGRIR